ncbi:molybdopterin-dependent oxidoreductase [Rhodospirillaceae bacterium]|nr:molybdopterin-dependent oxidoreductase [Rhodospirillaceae bacterium]MDC1441289.1 molybdopterin-dependent oxidoreductase [Rhodospirillaceae bacterium]
MSTDNERTQHFPTATQWGTYDAEVEGGRLKQLNDYAADPAPSIIGAGLIDAIDDKVRVRRPMVRKSFLEKGLRSNKSDRGSEPFVAVSWDKALDLAANEIDRVRKHHGNKSIFASSYGWASSGRFHHAQSQIHRFMNLAGGYVRHKNSYSHAAAEVTLKHIVADMKDIIHEQATDWPSIASDCELFIAFGGLPSKNAQVNLGGVGRHTLHEGMQACYDAGVEFVNISPLKTDIAEIFEPEWLTIRPNTDAAMMLALAYTLVTEKLYDKNFISTHTVGLDEFLPYLNGDSDGQPKSAEWAARITGVPAKSIIDLARRMADSRTMISTAWSLQRSDHGEQPIWLTVILASLLGQIGLPGGGFGIGYGCENGIGNPVKIFKWPALSQGTNIVKEFIPVARIADMLLSPGGQFDYDGLALTYPDIRLVYWAGGNPFHHHQDLNRLVEAFRQPECVIVNEIWWTATARHADIVFPITTVLERNDLMVTKWEPMATPMHKAIEPIGESRNDYDVFSELATRLGFREAFTEGRSEEEWLRHLWNQARQRAGEANFELPDFDVFWKEGPKDVLKAQDKKILLETFRNDPQKNPLSTPSGKIEIFSDVIAGFRYDDCPGHPVWMEPFEWLGSKAAKNFPLHIISNQPSTRLHSQLDSGAVSKGSKINDREPMTMNPEDAASRGIRTGDIVKIFNDRGSCLAGVNLSENIMPGVIQLATGAWFDPAVPGEIGALCKHGNPNVLTMDKGTSRLAQGPTALSTLVEVEIFDDDIPTITAHLPPTISSWKED